MTDTRQGFPRPPRKNPILATRVPVLPPAGRSRSALGLTSAATRGALALQVCEGCGTVQYPPRDLCGTCLSPDLVWRERPGLGRLLSETRVEASYELHFRDRPPRRVGLVRLADDDVTVVAFLEDGCPPAPGDVRLEARLDRAGRAVLTAFPRERGTGPNEREPGMSDDPAVRETTADPRHRKILVTDAKSEVGQATVRALIDGGAEIVWAGHAEPWKRPPGFDDLLAIDGVTAVPLDLTDSRSVTTLAGAVGAKVDILVNTAEFHRPQAPGAAHGVEIARQEMDVNYFGLVRLAEAFVPAMAARGADGPASAVAWVNLLSVFAHSGLAAHGSFAASKAAALSFSQSLRATLGRSGVRVVNLFPGPIDDEWNQDTVPPKLSPGRLAAAIVDALRRGIEDVYPDPIARDWYARWRDDPKALEREIAE